MSKTIREEMKQREQEVKSALRALFPKVKFQVSAFLTGPKIDCLTSWSGEPEEAEVIQKLQAEKLEAALQGSVSKGGRNVHVYFTVGQTGAMQMPGGEDGVGGNPGGRPPSVRPKGRK
jgi:hypothetical protein